MIELVIVLVIAAITLALAVPAYQNIIEKRQTTAKAEELASFLASAQGESVKMNRRVSVTTVRTGADNWCVGAIEGDAACDCNKTLVSEKSDADYCHLNKVDNDADKILSILDSDTYTKSNLSSISLDTTFVIDPTRGTLVSADLGAPHGFVISSDNGNWSLQVEVGVTGRVKVCNPVSNKSVSGFKACSGSI